MAQKRALMMVMAVSTMGLSGCSTMWNQVEKTAGFIVDGAEWVASPVLRGSKKDKENKAAEVKMAEATTTADDLSGDNSAVATDSGEDYVSYQDADITIYDTPDTSGLAGGSDISPASLCPAGTTLTSDNVCMMNDNDVSFVADASASTAPSETPATTTYSSYSSSSVPASTKPYASDVENIETSTVACPDGTYLTDDNTCMMIE